MNPKDSAVMMQRAAALVGGRERLRWQLGAPEDLFEQWVSGTAEVPVPIFLYVADLLAASAERQRTQASQAAHTKTVQKHERLVIESQVLHSIAAQTRAARHISAHEPQSRPSRHALPLLDPAFVPGDVAHLLAASLKAALTAAQTDLGNLQLIDGTGALRIAAQQGFEAPFLDFFAVVHEAESACGVALRERRQITIADVRTDPLFAGTPAGAAVLMAGAQAVQSTPLIDDRTGNLMGVVSTHYRAPGARSDKELALLDVIGRRAASWLEPVVR